MKNVISSLPGCPRQINRRDFIASCASCTLGLAGLSLLNINSLHANTMKKKLRIQIIYALHALKQDRPDWPNTGFDFNPVMEKINRVLNSGCPEFEFQSLTATGPEEATGILAAGQSAQVDGYIVFQMNCWNQVVQTIITSGKPVLYADFQFGGSGGFLVYTSGFLRNNIPNLGFIASSNMDDLVAAVKCFNLIEKGGTVIDFVNAIRKVRTERVPTIRKITPKSDDLKLLSTDDCIKRMKESHILAVRDENTEKAEPIIGIPLTYIPFAAVNKAWESADKEESRQIAAKWMKDASNVIGVPSETLVTSAAMYLGMKSVLKEYNANAITVNCLGGFYGGHIHAYPCLGFHELNNEGLVGGCECDVSSTATMVTFTTLTRGRPGYISDPVIDTSKRQIIYAHCVASNKAFGPDGPTNPFDIMTHSEDRQGASVRSILPTGYLTTSLQISNQRKEILFHQAIAVDNDPDDRACRTKLCAEPVGDIEKLFTMWDQWGWHRVTFYGDLKKPVYALADAIGWKVVEEA